MNPGFLSHLHSLAVTMSQKSSLIQFPKSVSQALTLDTQYWAAFGSISSLLFCEGRQRARLIHAHEAAIQPSHTARLSYFRSDSW